MSEGGNSDDIPVNLETGLLSVVRKIVNLLPDNYVKKVIGPILDQESIVVMANNPSILIRTAVVRVSHSLIWPHSCNTEKCIISASQPELLAVNVQFWTHCQRTVFTSINTVNGENFVVKKICSCASLRN